MSTLAIWRNERLARRATPMNLRMNSLESQSSSLLLAGTVSYFILLFSISSI